MGKKITTMKAEHDAPGTELDGLWSTAACHLTGHLPADVTYPAESLQFHVKVTVAGSARHSVALAAVIGGLLTAQGLAVDQRLYSLRYGDKTDVLDDAAQQFTQAEAN